MNVPNETSLAVSLPRARLVLLFPAVTMAVLSIVSMGCSNTPCPAFETPDGGEAAQETVGLSERELHDDTSLKVGMNHVVVLLLEPDDASTLHAGDIGEFGADTFTVNWTAGREQDYILDEHLRNIIAVKVHDDEKNAVLELNSSKAESQATLEKGVYTWAIDHVDESADARVVFVNPGAGTVSNDCEGCSLEGAKFSAHHFDGAKLSGANLKHSDFVLASCKETDFSNANLDGAILAGADCSKANFSGASLKGTTFLTAKLEGADFSDVTTDDDTDFSGTEFEGKIPSSSDKSDSPESGKSISSLTTDSVTVRPGQPYMIGTPGGTNQTINIGTLTIEDGGYVIIESGTQLRIQTLKTTGFGRQISGYEGIVVKGANGGAGAPGSAGGLGAAGTASNVNGQTGGTGGTGQAGRDGYNTPSVVINVGSVEGNLPITLIPGNGGPAGDGGNGGVGGTAANVDGNYLGDGGSGGPGGTGGNSGKGGDGGYVVVYYGSVSQGTFVTSTKGGISGASGRGGMGGQGGLGKATGANGASGQNGSFGSNGRAGMIQIVGRQ